jgi:hypothetical protein
VKGNPPPRQHKNETSAQPKKQPCFVAANEIHRGAKMARYGKAAQKSVKSAMDRRKHGTLKSGKGGRGGRVKSRKQAIAIGLSEARKKGAKVPRKKSS